MKKVLAILFLLLLVLIAILVINTLRFSSKQAAVEAISKLELGDDVVQRLAASIPIKTISYDAESEPDSAAFEQLYELIAVHFPLCDSLLKQQNFLTYSRLYTWQGSNLDLAPIVLMAHLDVVPIEKEEGWQEAPFSGKVKDGFIWGRGTLDDKVSAWAILEAVERLLKEGIQPQQTVYLAFGHDEEIGGKGARAMAEWIANQGRKPAMVLDEGMVITQGLMPGIDDPIALIGLSEKGYVTLALTAQGTGGHSSMPPPETAVGMIANAVAKVEANPLPQRIEGPIKMLFDYVGPEMPIHLRTVFANQWLLGGVLKSQLSKGNSTNAITRTTTAPTMLKGSIKENVLASEAKATINFRIIPGETADDVVRHITHAIDDERVQVSILGKHNNPTPVSDINSEVYQQLEKTVRQVFPEAIVAPSLTIATTDSRHYSGIAKNIFQFLPLRLGKDDLSRIHGQNERIGIENYKECIRFYYQLLKNVQ